MDPLEAKELFAPAIKKFKKRRIITRGIDELWASDVLHLRKYANENTVFVGGRGKKRKKVFQYVFVVVDACSKMLFLEKMESKKGPEATRVFEKILKTSKRKPQLLHTDKGGEYLNVGFKKMLRKHNIKMYHTFTKEKSALAERAIRTVNQKLAKYFAITGKHRWVNFLPKLVKEYNEVDIHRSIGLPPAQVNKRNESEILKRLFPAQKVDKPTLKPGDRVRIARDKDQFSSKYDPRWTREIFIIDKVHYTDPIVYSIKDESNEVVHGKFYIQELLKSKF